MEKTLKGFKGFSIALLVFALTSAIFAGFLKYTTLPESWSAIYILVCFCFATLFLGLFIGSLTMKRGLLYGGAGAFLFVVLVYYSATTLLNLPLAISLADLRFLVPILFGSIGGMFGVNLKS